MPKTLRRSSLVVATLLVVMLIGAPVYAHTFSAPSTATINYDGTNFFGNVDSAELSCEGGRTVNIRRQPANNIVATGTTNSSGNYTIVHPGANGSYFAEVLPRNDATYGHSHNCQGTASNTITIGGGGGGGGGPTPTPTPSPSPSASASVSPSPSPSGSPVGADSDVSLGHDGENFFGQVSSENQACASGREVKIFKKNGDGSTELFGTITTDATGQFELPAEDADGNYYAQVDQVSVGNAACNGATSDTITVAKDVPKGCKTNDPNKTIVGSSDDDVIVADEGKTQICGGDGDDDITGTGDDDQIKGGKGDDDIKGKGGKDNINGGGGDDNIKGGKKNDTMQGGGGNDSMNGNKGNDTLRGGPGDDDLKGGKGDDILRGGGGNDSLSGDKGNDILNGGKHTDSCSGGPGKDETSNCP